MSQQIPPRWHRLGESSLAKTRIFDLRTVRYRHPSRTAEKEFFVLNSRDWVNILAITPQNHLVLVNQFRFGIDTLSLEIPGGIIEDGEDPVAAGLRELEEETGFVGRNARLLATVHPNPAIMSNRCHLVLVEHCEPESALDWDEDEEMQVLTAPVAEVFEMARTGKITHSLVLDALLFLKLEMERAKE